MADNPASQPDPQPDSPDQRPVLTPVQALAFLAILASGSGVIAGLAAEGHGTQALGLGLVLVVFIFGSYLYARRGL